VGGQRCPAGVAFGDTYIGGVIRDAGTDVLTAVHVPLAMVIMGLVVWLPLRSRHHSDPATP